MKRILLIGLSICLVVSLSKASFCAEIDPDSLTLSDLKVSGATQDYLEAYKLFLKANVCDNDKGEYTYGKAIESLKKVSQTTKATEVKLRCLFLISFSYFLDGKTKEAYKTGLEALSLAKTYLKDNPKIALFDKIKSAIENKEITEISKVASLMDLGEEAAGLTKDLFYLQKNREDYQELVKKCWGKYKPAFDKKIASLANEQTLSPKELEKLKKELEERYSKQGFFISSELEKAFTEACLKSLTK